MLIVMEIFFHSDNAISDIGQDLVCKYDPDIDHFTQAKTVYDIYDCDIQ